MHTPHCAHQHMAMECIHYNNIISYFICMNWCSNVLISKQSKLSLSPSPTTAIACLFSGAHDQVRCHGNSSGKRMKRKTRKCLCDSHHSRWWFSYFGIWYATRCVALFRYAQYFNRNNVDSVGVCAQFEHRFYDCNFTASAFHGYHEQSADCGSVCACVWLYVMYSGTCYGIREQFKAKTEWP